MMTDSTRSIGSNSSARLTAHIGGVILKESPGNDHEVKREEELPQTVVAMDFSQSGASFMQDLDDLASWSNHAVNHNNTTTRRAAKETEEDVRYIFANSKARSHPSVALPRDNDLKPQPRKSKAKAPPVHVALPRDNDMFRPRQAKLRKSRSLGLSSPRLNPGSVLVALFSGKRKTSQTRESQDAELMSKERQHKPMEDSFSHTCAMSNSSGRSNY